MAATDPHAFETTPSRSTGNRALMGALVLGLSLVGVSCVASEEVCLETNWEWWLSAGGQFHGETSTTYNQQGDRLLFRMRSYEDDGVVIRRYLRSEAGLLEESELRDGEDPDGPLRERSVFVHDARGFVVTSWDDDLPGTGRKRVRQFENNDRGLPIREELDSDDDGRVDSVTERRWNHRDQRVSELDSEVDSEADSNGGTEEWSYTASGALREHSVSRVREGETTSRRTVHDYQGDRLVETRSWVDGDPYGEDPWPVRRVRFGPDGAEQNTFELGYDGSGNVVSELETTPELGETWRAERAWSCFVPEPYPQG